MKYLRSHIIMKILVTASAGFISSAMSMSLLERGDATFCIDNHNDYYDQKLKEDRVKRHNKNPNYRRGKNRYK